MPSAWERHCYHSNHTVITPLYRQIAFCQRCKVLLCYLLLFCRQGQCRSPQPDSPLLGLPDGGLQATPELALSADMLAPSVMGALQQSFTAA